MDELMKLLDDLIVCGMKLTETAQALKDYYHSQAENVPKETAKEEPKDTTKTYEDVEVRAALGEKAKIDGKKYKPDVKALVEKYSTDNTFSGIPADKYNDLMKELEGIGNE
jgi:hypothetical protein